MAIVVETEFSGPGATAANYDAVITKMGCFPAGRHPDPGCLFHWMRVESPTKFLVVDVWKSEEYWNVFLQNILGPATAGGPLPPPTIRIHHLHNFLRAGGLDPL
jgi:hypothetical protein